VLLTALGVCGTMSWLVHRPLHTTFGATRLSASSKPFDRCEGPVQPALWAIHGCRPACIPTCQSLLEICCETSRQEGFAKAADPLHHLSAQDRNSRTSWTVATPPYHDGTTHPEELIDRPHARGLMPVRQSPVMLPR